MDRPNNKHRFTPLLIAISVVLGILVGTFYANHFSGNRLSIISTSGNKLNNLLHIISDQYVDEVKIDSIVEKAVPTILSELDPHSVYISAADVQNINDELKSSFSGIGVEFSIRKDTIHVQNVIKNGPAERAGVQAGDRIIKVDGRLFVGKICTNTEAQHRLKGPKGTKVTVSVMRRGEKNLRDITITRGDIPQKSISAAYMLDDKTGYIKVKSFAENTYPEMLVALASLQKEDFQNLVIDLRDNTGGLMGSAVQMANEFLPKNKMIVYMQGRKTPRQDFKSNGQGSYQNIPLIVLIDEGSASASEIFAGSIQDNDRGTIIGKRSFGKGLVQQPISFNDGSMIRLTIARYYTPSGRCIQKPYADGQDPQYRDDLLVRYQNGEFFSQDSIKHEGPEYKTALGRIVYGGGGITPDIFVPDDTTDMTSYYKEAIISGRIIQFTYQYTDENRSKLKEFTTLNGLVSYLDKQNLVDKFVNYAEKDGMKRRNNLIRKSRNLLDKFLKSRIVYNILDEQALHEYLNRDDKTVLKAIDVMNKGAAFPKKPEKQQDAGQQKKAA